MKAMICLDDKNGMMFNRRRQSRDSVLTARIAEISKGKRLFLNSYSEPLFKESGANLFVSENFLEIAEVDDFCFVENLDLPLENCEELYIFRWNRLYPADMFFNKDPNRFGLSLVSSEDFAGSSHEKITLEIYEKRRNHEK